MLRNERKCKHIFMYLKINLVVQQLKSMAPLMKIFLIINARYYSMENAVICERVTIVICGWSGTNRSQNINTLRPRQNGRHFADDIFKYIFLNENVWIPIRISMKFVPKGPINNIPALVQIMACRHLSDKPSLSEPRMISSLTHICVTRPQWVNKFNVHKYLGASS